jgi:hypothetical protein
LKVSFNDTFRSASKFNSGFVRESNDFAVIARKDRLDGCLMNVKRETKRLAGSIGEQVTPIPIMWHRFDGFDTEGHKEFERLGRAKWCVRKHEIIRQMESRL